VRPIPDRLTEFAIVIGIAAVAVRFIAINQPFIDEWSWRQSDVASIARNFCAHANSSKTLSKSWLSGNLPGDDGRGKVEAGGAIA
jgi:hypothetical protein